MCPINSIAITPVAIITQCYTTLLCAGNTRQWNIRIDEESIHTREHLRTWPPNFQKFYVWYEWIVEAREAVVLFWFSALGKKLHIFMLKSNSMLKNWINCLTEEVIIMSPNTITWKFVEHDPETDAAKLHTNIIFLLGGEKLGTSCLWREPKIFDQALRSQMKIVLFWSFKQILFSQRSDDTETDNMAQANGGNAMWKALSRYKFCLCILRQHILGKLDVVVLPCV